MSRFGRVLTCCRLTLWWCSSFFIVVGAVALLPLGMAAKAARLDIRRALEPTRGLGGTGRSVRRVTASERKRGTDLLCITCFGPTTYIIRLRTSVARIGVYALKPGYGDGFVDNFLPVVYSDVRLASNGGRP